MNSKGLIYTIELINSFRAVLMIPYNSPYYLDIKSLGKSLDSMNPTVLTYTIDMINISRTLKWFSITHLILRH